MFDICKSPVGMAFFRTQIDDDGNEIVRDWSEPTPSSSYTSQHAVKPQRLHVRITDYQSNIYAYKHTLRASASAKSQRKSGSKSTTESSSSEPIKTVRTVQSHRTAQTLQAVPKQRSVSAIVQARQHSFEMNDDSEDEENGGSNIVPPLDLQSKTTGRSEVYSIYSGLRRDPQLAFETWLSAKRKQIADRASQVRRMEAEKQRQQEERKRLAEQKYELWLRKKNEALAKQKEQQADKQKAKAVTPRKRFAHLSDEERAIRLRLWLMGKKIKCERERLLNVTVNTLEKHYRTERKRLAEEAFRNWLVGAGAKPKPVPLNRGLFSLRGTINRLYVNPNAWQSLPIEEKPTKTAVKQK